MSSLMTWHIVIWSKRLCTVAVQTAVSIMALLFDSAAVILTCIKTYRHSRDMRQMQFTSITSLLLRDGKYMMRNVVLNNHNWMCYTGILYYVWVSKSGSWFILLKTSRSITGITMATVVTNIVRRHPILNSRLWRPTRLFRYLYSLTAVMSVLNPLYTKVGRLKPMFLHGSFR